MSSFVRDDNKKKRYSSSWWRSYLRSDAITSTAEKKFSINSTGNNNKVCLSLLYNGGNSYIFVNGTEITKFKAKDSAIVATPLFLGNFSKDFSVNDMKQTGLKGYVYDFSVNHDVVAVGDMLDIHKYLMKNNDIM